MASKHVHLNLTQNLVLVMNMIRMKWKIFSRLPFHLPNVPHHTAPPTNQQSSRFGFREVWVPFDCQTIDGTHVYIENPFVSAPLSYTYQPHGASKSTSDCLWSSCKPSIDEKPWVYRTVQRRWRGDWQPQDRHNNRTAHQQLHLPLLFRFLCLSLLSCVSSVGDKLENRPFRKIVCTHHIDDVQLYHGLQYASPACSCY